MNASFVVIYEMQRSVVLNARVQDYKLRFMNQSVAKTEDPRVHNIHIHIL